MPFDPSTATLAPEHFDSTTATPAPEPTAFDPSTAVPPEQHVQRLIQDPKFSPADYAIQTGDKETAFQARQALQNRTAGEKLGAVGQTLAEPETYGNALAGAGKFALGLAAAPLHTLAQGAATVGAPVARALGAPDLANTLENEQQTQGAEATLAGQQVEQGIRNTARNVADFAKHHPVIASAAYPMLGPANALLGMRGPADEAYERAQFDKEIEAAKNQQQLAQQQPLETGAVAGASKIATGQDKLSDVYSPEALAAQGARPVSPLVTESMAAAGDPQNLLIPLAGEIPGVKTLAGGIVQGAGKILQAPEAIMSAIPKVGKFGRLMEGGAGAGYLFHNPAAVVPAASAWGLGKVLGYAGRAMDDQGAAFRTGVASAADNAALDAASQSGNAFNANVQRTIGNTANNVVATALGFAPVNYVTSDGDPRAFAQAEAGAGVMGGVFGLAGNRARLENVAAQKLAQYGSQQFSENPLWTVHQQQMEKMTPEDQAQVNVLRGTLFGGTGTDVLVLDGPTFAAKAGQIGADARGMYAQDQGTIYLNSDAIGNQKGVSDAANHETGHAIVDFLKNAGREGDAQNLFSNIAQNISLNDLGSTIEAYRQKLANSTPGYKTGTPEQKAAIEATIAQANPPEKILEENLAEITRNILTGKSIASYALPQPILERLTDAASRFFENRGWMPKIDPNAGLGFKAQMVNESARRMNAILYETGKKAIGEINKGPTVTQQLLEAQAKLAGVPPITPNMPVAQAMVLQRTRDAAQKEINDLQGMLGNLPAPAPQQAAGTAQTTGAGNLNRYRIAAILRQQGLTQADAKQWADAAEGKTDEEAVVNALRARANAKFPTTSTFTVTPGQTFNDEIGQSHKVTGENAAPPEVGSIVVATDGKAYRVTKVWDNGSVDVAYTSSPANSRPANTLRTGSFKRVETEPIQTAPNVQRVPSPQGQQIPPVAGVPSAGGAATQEAPTPVAAGSQTPEPASSGGTALSVRPAGGGRFVILDAAGNPINNRTYASESSAQAAIRQQGSTIKLGLAPGGVEDALNHVVKLGGIAPKKGTQEYDDMAKATGQGGYGPLISGTEAPEDIANALHNDLNIGDGTVSGLWQTIADAINNRRNSTIKKEPTEAAQEREGRAQAEAHVAQVLADAEAKATAAEKNTKTKAAKDRIQRAKINAILDDIGDDPTGLHRITDQFGNESIVGPYDPTDPRHKALADMGGLAPKDGQKVAKIQQDKGNVIYMRYRSALSNAEQAQGLAGEATRENTETGMTKRQEEYSEDPAAERTQGTIQQKAVIPISTEVNSPSGKLTMKFVALDNILHNMASIFEGMKGIGRANPYGDTPAQQQPLLVQDATAYAQNHAHGYRGDGSGPITSFPDSGLPAADPNYTPKQIPADRFAALNMAFHNESAGKLADLNARVQKYQAEGKDVPKSVMAQWTKAQESYALANENTVAVDHESGETNQLRAELKAAGFDTQDRLKPPIETLAPQHILETSDKPIPLQPGDVPSVRPTGFSVDPAELGRKGLPISKAVASGFLPAEEAGAEDKSEAVKARAAKLWVEQGTDSPFFKKWFGGSKVTDENGSPMPAFHGTPNAGFNTFDTNRQGRDSGWYGTGAYFTLRPSEVNAYSAHIGSSYYGDTSGSYKVFLKIENPLRVENRNDMANQIQRLGGDPNLEGKALTNEIQRLGFDGVITNDGGEAVAFKPDQIKSATGNQGTFDASNPDMRFMPDEDTGKPEEGRTPGERLGREAEAAGIPLSMATLKGLMQQDQTVMDAIRRRIETKTGHPAKFMPADEDEPFYSQLTRTVQNLPQATMTVGQARAAITKGAKPDEIKQQGILDDPLSPLSGKGDNERVTKADLLGYSLERQAKVQDVVLGNNNPPIPNFKITTRGIRWVAEDHNGNQLATLGRGEARTEEDAKSLFTKRFQDQNDKTHFSQFQLPGADEGSYRESFVTFPNEQIARKDYTEHAQRVAEWNRAQNAVDQYQDEHPDSDPRDDAALMRLISKRNTLKDEAASAVPAGWNDGHAQYQSIANPVVRLRYNIRPDSQGRKTLFLEEMQGPNPDNQEKMPPELRKRIYDIGMKRAIRTAIDEGADALGWTDGETQADRYDLSKQVDRVQWDERRQKLWAFKNGSQVMNKSDVTRDNLADYIGKDAAQKILAGEPNEHRSGDHDFYTREISGEDLKVGGEGLKNLYDQMLPRIANKLAEKAGGKVEAGSIVNDALTMTQKGMVVSSSNSGKRHAVFEALEDPNYEGEGDHALRGKQLSPWFENPNDANDWMDANAPGLKIHTLPIPEAWKQNAPQFPLYLPAGEQQGSQQAPQNSRLAPAASRADDTKRKARQRLAMAGA